MNYQVDKHIKVFVVFFISIVSILFVVLSFSIGSIVKEALNKPQPTEEPVNNDNIIKIDGSHAPGYYPDEFDFSMTCNDENAKIIYTMTSPAKRDASSSEKVALTGEVYMYSGGKFPNPNEINEQGIRQSIEYTDPIRIPGNVMPASETVRVTTIIAAAFKDNERVSSYYYYTFFVDGKGKRPNYSDKFGSYVV